MCCPSSVAGPAKWPRRVPPENILLSEVGSSFVMRTSTFRVRFPYPCRWNSSTLWTVTVVGWFEAPKSMAIHGAVVLKFVWQILKWPLESMGPVTPSIQLPAPNWVVSFPYVDDWVAVTGLSSTSMEKILNKRF